MERNALIPIIADLIIPAGPNGQPSASQSRAVDFIVNYLEDGGGFAEEIRSFIEGLPESDLLDEPLLKKAEFKNPTAFRHLVELVYTSYYGDPKIVEKLGLPGPPQPKGYSMEPFDVSLLDPVINPQKER